MNKEDISACSVAKSIFFRFIYGKHGTIKWQQSFQSSKGWSVSKFFKEWDAKINLFNPLQVSTFKAFFVKA